MGTVPVWHLTVTVSTPWGKEHSLNVQQLNGEAGATENNHKGRKGYRAQSSGRAQRFLFFYMAGKHHSHGLTKLET